MVAIAAVAVLLGFVLGNFKTFMIALVSLV